MTMEIVHSRLAVEEVPMVPMPLRAGERAVLWLEPGQLPAGPVLVVELWERNTAEKPVRTAVGAEVARRCPEETARFLRLTLDAALADLRSARP